MKNSLKKWGVLLCLTMFFACTDKYSFDERLDGMWQMTDTSIYYSFHVNVVNVKKTGGGSYFGHFVYRNDSLHLTIRNASRKAVEPMGLKDTIQGFEVEKLTHKRLVLRSDDSRLTFRKY